MSMQAPKPLTLKETPEYWLHLTESEIASGQFLYRPAILVECGVNFRSLRAGLNHSEERSYTAWIPEADLAMDWDIAALSADQELKFQATPAANIGYVAKRY